jgi:hypothetical protein
LAWPGKAGRGTTGRGEAREIKKLEAKTGKLQEKIWPGGGRGRKGGIGPKKPRSLWDEEQKNGEVKIIFINWAEEGPERKEIKI